MADVRTHLGNSVADRLLLLIYRSLFTAGLASLFWSQRLAESKAAGKIVVWQNRLLSGRRYDRMIDLSVRWYGAALDEALNHAMTLSRRSIGRIVDCGTGTGFVSCSIARRLPESQIVDVDALAEMLSVARANVNRLTDKGMYVRGLLGSLPLKNSVADLVIAQNTIPVLREFGRICRPGGVVVFVESAVDLALVATLARRSAERVQMFDAIEARRARIGFYLIARRMQH
jgi:SAM-dependent methyltransferase